MKETQVCEQVTGKCPFVINSFYFTSRAGRRLLAGKMLLAGEYKAE